MNKVSKKTMKASKKDKMPKVESLEVKDENFNNDDIKVEELATKKIKKSKKNKEIEDIKVEDVLTEKINKSKKKKSETIEISKENDVEMDVVEKIKKSKKRKTSEKDDTQAAELPKIKKIKVNESDETNEIEIDDSKIDTDESVKAKSAPFFNAIIVNLPSEVSKEELINFLSNRGIPIDGLQLNNNKYAIIETDCVDKVEQITNLLSTKPMTDNTEMKVSQLFGNAVKLSNFSAKKPLANHRVVIVKNVDCKTSIDTILAATDKKNDIVRHSSVFVQNHGAKTQMLTIEFPNAQLSEDVVSKLNSLTIDGRQLVADYKYNLVDPEIETRTDALIIRNMPQSVTKESITELVKRLGIVTQSVTLLQKSGRCNCYLKFAKVKKASEAFDSLREELIDGMKLEIKFVAEPKENGDGELAKTRLRITNLPFTIKKEDMEKEFDSAESVKVPMTSYGKSKGLCYLSYATEEMAALVMDAVQERIINGKKIKCEYVAKSAAFEETDNCEDKTPKPNSKPKEKPVGAVITLFNLPAGVTQKDIISNFSNVKLVNIVKKGESFKGIAEVHFKDATAAHAAMSAPLFSLRGREIRKELKGGNWRIGTEPKKVPAVKKSNKSDNKDESDSEEEESESNSAEN